MCVCVCACVRVCVLVSLLLFKSLLVVIVVVGSFSLFAAWQLVTCIITLYLNFNTLRYINLLNIQLTALRPACNFSTILKFWQSIFQGNLKFSKLKRLALNQIILRHFRSKTQSQTGLPMIVKYLQSLCSFAVQINQICKLRIIISSIHIK